MTNYEKYFGTLERAAEMLVHIGWVNGYCVLNFNDDPIFSCNDCEKESTCEIGTGGYKAICTEWLESEVTQ